MVVLTRSARRDLKILELIANGSDLVIILMYIVVLRIFSLVFLRILDFIYTLFTELLGLHISDSG